jgi:hypothetical protein
MNYAGCVSSAKVRRLRILGKGGPLGIRRDRRLNFYDVQQNPLHDEEPLYLAGRRFSLTLNPSCPSTLTAPVFPPSKSLEPSRWPVANS